MFSISDCMQIGFMDGSFSPLISWPFCYRSKYLEWDKLIYILLHTHTSLSKTCRVRFSALDSKFSFSPTEKWVWSRFGAFESYRFYNDETKIWRSIPCMHACSYVLHGLSFSTFYIAMGYGDKLYILNIPSLTLLELYRWIKCIAASWAGAPVKEQAISCQGIR